MWGRVRHLRSFGLSEVGIGKNLGYLPLRAKVGWRAVGGAGRVVMRGAGCEKMTEIDSISSRLIETMSIGSALRFLALISIALSTAFDLSLGFPDLADVLVALSSPLGAGFAT